MLLYTHIMRLLHQLKRNIIKPLMLGIGKVLSNFPPIGIKLIKSKNPILKGSILGLLCISLSFCSSQFLTSFQGRTSVAATTIVPPLSAKL
ncbi:MAG: hypothetical protein AAFY21_06210 [Cyanobacteria bacterium J06641_2]